MQNYRTRNNVVGECGVWSVEFKVWSAKLDVHIAPAKSS